MAGLGQVNVGEKGMDQDTIDHIAHGFEEISRRLKALPQAVQELASREGCALAQAAAEHVLACYRSWDPNFSLEPVQQGVARPRKGPPGRLSRVSSPRWRLAAKTPRCRYRAVAAATKTPRRLQSLPT